MGREELEKSFRDGLAEHPTIGFEIEDIVAEDDKVAAG